MLFSGCQNLRKNLKLPLKVNPTIYNLEYLKTAVSGIIVHS